jgi:membrane protease YdiL (CAAX protease family)
MSEFKFDIGPTDSTPPPDLGERMVMLGRVLLYSLVTLLIVGQLVAYFDRKPEKSSFKDVDQAIKIQLYQSVLQNSKFTSKQLPLDKLKDDNSPLATRYRVAIKYAEEGKVSEKDIEELSKHKDNEYLAKALADKDLKKALKSLTNSKPADMAVALIIGTLQKNLNEEEPYRNIVSKKDAVNFFTFIFAALGAAALGVAIWAAFFISGLTRKHTFVHPTQIEQGNPLDLANSPEAVAQAKVRNSLALRAFLGLFTYFIVVPLLLSPFISRRDYSQVEGTILNVLVVAVTIAITMRAPINGTRLTWKDLGIEREKLWKGIGTGVLAAFANIPVLFASLILVTVLQKFLPQAEHPLGNEIMKNTSPTAIISYLILASVLAPIYEELVFRGAMLGDSLRKFSPVGAILLVNFCFAAIHPTGIPAWPALMAVGITASLACMYSRSLISSIVLHALHNGMIVMFSVMMS